MNRKTNGHSANHIKRQAKKIKKEIGIPHHEALDKAASRVGFTNWKSFLRSSVAPVSRQHVKQTPQVLVPNPPVLTYYSVFSKNGDKRPNAKMPLSLHQELGLLLKEVRTATDNCKRARRPIDDIRSKLDDWIQYEYTSREELPDEIFFSIYYGDHEPTSNRLPSAELKRKLVKILQRVKAIIKKGYHDCRPVGELERKLDLAVSAIKNWPLGKKGRGVQLKGKQLPAGTLIHLKSNRKPAVVIQHDIWNDILVCYADMGRISTIREEVSVSRDQSNLSRFKPMRLLLPYGKWTCPDGTEVLFNRDYCPLWSRELNDIAIQIDPDTWIDYQGEADFYFDDSNAPWHGNRVKLVKCLAVLKEWGVENITSSLMNLLHTAIKTGNTDLLKPKNRTKIFPANSA